VPIRRPDAPEKENGVTTAPSSPRVPRQVRRIALVASGAAGLVLAGLALQAAPSSEPDGPALYRSYCASCHGLSGRGNGPMVEFLRVPPTNLTLLSRIHGGTFNEEAVAQAIDGRRRIGSHGPSDMPVWGDAFSSSLAQGGPEALRARVRAIVRHLESLQERQAP
jgi:hypothetical protein